MPTNTTRFTRGETFRAVLKVTSGDASDRTCRMVMKKALNGRLPPGDGAPVDAELAVEYVDHIDAEDEDSLPGFIGELSAADSEGLDVATYALDARTELDGDVAQTPIVLVMVDERVTGPADV